MYPFRWAILILTISASTQKGHSQPQAAQADASQSLPQARLWRITFTETRHHKISLDTTLLVIKSPGMTHYLAGSPQEGYKEIKALDNPEFQTGQWVYAPAGRNTIYAYRLCTPFTRQSLPKEFTTYILSPDPTDHIIGMTLNAENPNRYSNMGAALSQSPDPLLVETKLSTLIADQRLDEYNRGLLQLLRQSYLQHKRAGQPIPQRSELIAAQ